jgi:hypothetical protein
MCTVEKSPSGRTSIMTHFMAFRDRKTSSHSGVIKIQKDEEASAGKGGGGGSPRTPAGQTAAGRSGAAASPLEALQAQMDGLTAGAEGSHSNKSHRQSGRGTPRPASISEEEEEVTERA